MLKFIFLKINQKHNRTPSQIDTSEFKALTKLDAYKSIQKELGKLLLTCPQKDVEQVKNEFTGFERLFKRYLEDANAEIKWQNIEPLNDDTVGLFSNVSIRFS